MRAFALTSLLILSGLGSTVAPLACGDKFLLPSRGTRFQQPPRDRVPASILLYANPSSPLPEALSRLSVNAALRKVGYRPTFVDSLAALERAVSQGGWDVIVVDLGDGPAVRSRVAGNAATIVLPVAIHATGDQVGRARTAYSRVIKSPGRSQVFVDAVDDALAGRRTDAAEPKSR